MPATTKINLRLLGEIEVRRGDTPISLPRSKKTRALLAYLAMAERPQRRDRLCTVFWEVADDPRGELRWCLSKLRQVVDEPDCKRILTDRETVRLDPSAIDVDLLRLRDLAAAGLDTAPLAELEAAAERFTGAFLERLDLPNCPEFLTWRIAEQEQIRRLHAEILSQLVQRLRDKPDAALPHARRLVEVNPDAESAHAGLIKLLANSGRRLEAEELCRQAERHLGEIGVRPSGALIKARQELANRQQASDRDETPDPPPNETPPAVGTAGDALEPERKHVTILAATLVDSAQSAGSEDPEVALRRLDPVLDAMKAAVRRYGGTVTNLPGDGITALFGAPKAYEDHAARACFAALLLRDSVRDSTADGFDIRIGLHSGEAVVRTIEDEQSRHFEAVGPVVSLARKIQGALQPGTIGLSPETSQRADGFVRVRPMGSAANAEQSAAVECYELIGRTAARSRWEARVTRALTRFVGRDQELAVIGRAHEQADAGEGKLVAIVGEPGVGKSRLAHEHLRSPQARGWTLLRTGATSHGQDTAYRPVSDLLRSWCRVEERDAQAAVAEKLKTELERLDEKLMATMPALSFLLDLPVEDKDWQHQSPAKRRRRVHEALKGLLIRLSRHRPLILLVEDLHWIDGETHAFLDTLVEALTAARILLLVTYRPEFQHSWAGRSSFSLVRGDPLRADMAEQLLRSLLGDDPSLTDLKQGLIERSGGNPLFLEEMVRALMETGSLTGGGGRYRLAEATVDLKMPLTIREVLAARIDRLPPDSKTLLQVAAVIGQEVPLALLQPIARLAEDDLHDTLATLQSAELLYETRLDPDPAYSFKHALTHEVALAGVLHEQRRQLHIEVVGTIEELFQNRLDEQVERLGHHALAGGLWKAAARYLGQAGDKAVERSAYQEASRFYGQALTAMEHLQDDREQTEQGIDLRLKLRVALNTIGSFEAMLDTLVEAEDLAEKINDHQRRAKVNLAKIWALGLLGDVDGAIESGRRAVASGNVLGTRAVVACADLGIGWAHWQRGEAREAVDFLSRHRAFLCGDLRFETFGSISVRSVFCLSNLGRNHALLGAFRDAMEAGTASCAIAEELGRPFDLAYAYWHFGSVLLHRGEIDEALSYLTQAYEINQANEFEFTTVGVSVDLGYAHLLSGQTSIAVPLLELARSTSERTRHAHNHVWATVYLGVAKLRDGLHEPARSLAQQALEEARTCRFQRAEGLALQLLGLADTDETNAAATHAEEHLLAANALFERLGLRPDLANCHRNLAAHYEGIGDQDKAAIHHKTAFRLCADMEMSLHDLTAAANS